MLLMVQFRANPGDPSAPVTEGGFGQVLDEPVADEETWTAEEQAREWSVAVKPGSHARKTGWQSSRGDEALP